MWTMVVVLRVIKEYERGWTVQNKYLSTRGIVSLPMIMALATVPEYRELYNKLILGTYPTKTIFT